jgi:hypothetical protein
MKITFSGSLLCYSFYNSWQLTILFIVLLWLQQFGWRRKHATNNRFTKGGNLLGYSAVQSRISRRTFQKYVLPPSSFVEFWCLLFICCLFNNAASNSDNAVSNCGMNGGLDRLCKVATIALHEELHWYLPSRVTEAVNALDRIADYRAEIWLSLFQFPSCLPASFIFYDYSELHYAILHLYTLRLSSPNYLTLYLSTVSMIVYT